ncbi:Hsp20/alpha crystallin family protein [Kribbella koreensis]|uniref:Hsp20/alpha crystallin family protein n=2 Tax=Kribbella TaxID=182639 RepID=A0ABP6YVP5_9ACTN
MTTLERKDGRHQFADLFDWADSLPNMFSWPAAIRGVRIEEYADGDRYVVKAELPGIDPEPDLKVEVANGILTIAATRRQEEHTGTRTEFHYGSLTRRIFLPEGADESAVTAQYDAGILEVSVPTTTRSVETRTVPITRKS